MCRRPARRPRHGASPALCRFLQVALLALAVPPNRLFVYPVACVLSERRHPAVAFNRLFASLAVQGEFAKLVTSGARSCERLAHHGAAALGGWPARVVRVLYVVFTMLHLQFSLSPR